jgi:hypothetical protein
MQVMSENGELVIHAGRLRGETRLPMSGIDRWDMLYDLPFGRRYLAFHAGDRTHFVNLPALPPAARTRLLGEITALLGQAPDTELLAMERDNAHWQLAWDFIKRIGRYLRLFINPRAPLR